jgi:melibiose permease
MMLFFPLLRKVFSTIRIFYISFVMAVLGYVTLLVLTFTNMSSVVLLFIPGFFIFASFGMMTVLTTIFLANTVDYGEWKNHQRDESVIFSMQTFVVKLASGLAAFIVSICLTICNLSEATTNAEDTAQTIAASSVLVLRMTMTVIPIIGIILAIVIFYKKYCLTEEKVEEIAAQLKAKR